VCNPRQVPCYVGVVFLVFCYMYCLLELKYVAIVLLAAPGARAAHPGDCVCCSCDVWQVPGLGFGQKVISCVTLVGVLGTVE